MVRIKGLRKRFGSVEVLKGIDLHVREGETVAVMGPSGCGKSTLLRSINRLIEPDEGEIVVDGCPVRRLHGEALEGLRRRIGCVFQDGHLIRRLSALDNVLMPLRFARVEPEEALLRAGDALTQVGLWDMRHRRPDELSGGERQRVAIARALALQPRLMLWDEPTSALDPILVREVLDVMAALVRTSRTTMIIVTHEADFARRFADRIVLMDDGRIVESGSPEQVFGYPRSTVGRMYKRLLAPFLPALPEADEGSEAEHRQGGGQQDEGHEAESFRQGVPSFSSRGRAHGHRQHEGYGNGPGDDAP